VMLSLMTLRAPGLKKYNSSTPGECGLVGYPFKLDSLSPFVFVHPLRTDQNIFTSCLTPSHHVLLRHWQEKEMAGREEEEVKYLIP